MGGCLDLPSPPPKEYRDGKYGYQNGVKYRTKKSPGVSLRSRSSVVSAGSMGRISGHYSAYQPYAPMYGPPIQPLVAVDPNTGQAYQYYPPIPLPPPHAYPVDVYANGYYDYYGYEGIDTEKKRSKHRKSKKENGLDRNANRKSTVITTFPDPSDDVIIQGDETLPSRIVNPVSVIATDVQRTTASGTVVQQTSSIVTSTETTSSSINQESAAQLTTGQHIYAEAGQAFSSLSNRPTRGSTYVTYIKDVALPPKEIEVQEVIVRETEEREATTTVTETTNIAQIESTNEYVATTTSGADVVEEATGMFVETSGPVEGIDTLMVDETVTRTEISSTVDTSRSLLLQTRLVRQASEGCDVVITGVPEDLDLIRRLVRMIEGCGMTVAVSVADPNRSEDDASRAGQAIVDSKVLVVILSMTSVQSNMVRDEVSLARVSDSVIFPVALDETLDVLDRIDIRLKLQVAGYKWTELRDRDHPSDIVLDLFVNSLKEELEVIRSNPDIIDEDYGQVSNRAERRHNMMRRRQMLRMISSANTVTAAQFWNNNYPGLSEVEWTRFRLDFIDAFKSHLERTLERSGQLNSLEAFKRELTLDSTEVVTKAQFVVFCNDDGQDEDLWEKYIAFARETLAIRDVFDVESSVRLVAIQNIGRFGSPAVMNALRDLLSDQDANIRAVAAVSLSRCISPSDELSFRLLLLTLDDEDRLVREAGCLAMGHLRAKQAVNKLADMWRNDVISQVREAASAALEEIGGDEAEESMKVTRILAEEIQALS